jgi:hypothetical protein
MMRQEYFLDVLLREFITLVQTDSHMSEEERQEALLAIDTITSNKHARDNLQLAISARLWELNEVATVKHAGELEVIGHMLVSMANKEGYISKEALLSTFTSIIMEDRQGETDLSKDEVDAVADEDDTPPEGWTN